MRYLTDEAVVGASWLLVVISLLLAVLLGALARCGDEDGGMYMPAPAEAPSAVEGSNGGQMHKTRQAYEAATAEIRARLVKGESVYVTELPNHDGDGKFTTITRYFTDVSDARVAVLLWMDVAHRHRISVDFRSFEPNGRDWNCELSMNVTRATDEQDVPAVQQAEVSA